MKKSVYEFEQKVRKLWTDKESVSAYPFGRHYGALLSRPFAVSERVIIYVVDYSNVPMKDLEMLIEDRELYGSKYIPKYILCGYDFETGEEYNIYEIDYPDMQDSMGSKVLFGENCYPYDMRIYRNNAGELFLKMRIYESYSKPKYDAIARLEPAAKRTKENCKYISTWKEGWCSAWENTELYYIKREAYGYGSRFPGVHTYTCLNEEEVCAFINDEKNREKWEMLAKTRRSRSIHSTDDNHWYY